MIDLLRRIGGVLITPRKLFASLPQGTGRHDGLALVIAYVLAIDLPGLAAATADFIALGLIPGLSGLAQVLLPLLPWVLTLSLVEWRLGDGRTHRAALCMVPLLVLTTLAHLAEQRSLTIPGPFYLVPLIGGLASLALAHRARPAIATTPTADLSPKPASLPATALGLAITALVATTASLDATTVARSWSTLAPVAAGAPMPQFELPLLDGGTLQTADLQGAPHLLIFWTTWCGVCTGEMPMYSALATRHPSLKVIGINADRDGDIPDLVRAYRVAHDLRFPIALDRGHLGRDLRVRMYPHLVLTNSDGTIAAVFRGRTFERSLESAIAALE